MRSLSVIVPTYNRLDRLRHVLAALERQRCGPDRFEVVVVSDGSTDGTDAYLEGLRSPLRLRWAAQPNRGVAAARNHGVELATGDYLLFVDDDVVPAPVLVSEHMRAHEERGDEVVVLGPMLTPDNFGMRPWVRWEQTLLQRQYADMLRGRYAPTARQFYTGNTSLARRHVVEAGGFDESFRRAEDVELAYRLAARGLAFVFEPAAAAYHYAERSYRSWFATPYAYGRNDVIFTRDKGQSWLLPKVCGEFYERRAPVRGLVRLCLDRPWLSAMAYAGLNALGRAGDRAGAHELSLMSYSAIFNLRYYQGVADELGGRAHFFRRLSPPQGSESAYS